MSRQLSIEPNRDITREGGSSGETNTMSNVGSGAGLLYKQKTGVDFEIKRLIAGSGVSLSNNASDITLSAGAAAGSAGAWLTFSTVQFAIKASYNVSSVTNQGVGVCLVTFSNALANSTYAVATGGQRLKQSTYPVVNTGSTKSTTQCTIRSSVGNVDTDLLEISVLFFDT